MDDVYEELVGSNNTTTLIIKGKRTKRLASCSSSGGRGGKDVCDYSLEDEDMANCLILLAQGGCIKQEDKYLYKCKICNRTFQSFQALGGHMTSHKRSKIFGDNNNTKSIFTTSNSHIQQEFRTQHLSLISTKNHECSICGMEFSSGQALGGHMRRHRNISTIGKVTTINDERNFFPLDLNLPASVSVSASPPEDHPREMELKFQFGGENQQLQVFSASALVDCHY